MKTFKESTKNYECTGCGVAIFNATKKYTTCPECGYEVTPWVPPKRAKADRINIKKLAKAVAEIIEGGSHGR